MVSNFVKRTLPLTTLRFFEFGASVIVMSLLAFAVNDFGFHGSKKINYGLAVGVISVFYLICVFLGSLILPSLVLAGLLALCEFIMLGLWISAFIVLADSIGKSGCNNKVTSTYDPKYGSLMEYESSGGEYNEFTEKYGVGRSGRGCNATKTSVAFAGLAAVLFIISFILVIVNIVVPIAKHYGFGGLFKSGSSMNTRVHRSSALTLSEPVGNVYDYETGTGIPQTTAADTRMANGEVSAPQPVTNAGVATADQNTYSTGASSNEAYIQEKNTAAATAANAAVTNTPGSGATAI